MNEVFGTAGQRALLTKGAWLMRILAHDPAYCSHGRGVQLASYDANSADLVEQIARLTGASGCENVPREETPALASALEARGLNVDVFQIYLGGEDCIDLARDVLQRRPLPADLSVRVIDRDAPTEVLDAFAEVALAQGVLPSIGSSLRGTDRPGFGMVAFDGTGRPVATAAALRSRHPEHPQVDTVHWGQLATVDDRKGEGIARALGAMSILHAAEQVGARGFKTGIRAGNTPSIGLCSGLGVRETRSDVVLAMDPAAFSGDRITK